MRRMFRSGFSKAKYLLYTASALAVAPEVFAQGSDWDEAEQVIKGGINVAKSSAKGVGELFFGLLPVVVLVVAGVGTWFGAKKKAEREDKDTKWIPLLWGLVGAVLGFGLVLFMYVVLEKSGIPARQKAMDFWS